MHIKTADGDRNVASQGLGGAALGLAIPGTLAFLNQISNNGGWGLLGGNNNAGVAAAAAVGQRDYIGHLQAENGQLKAEKYSDNNAKEVYQQTLADNRNLRDELYAFIKPLAEEAANNRVNIATLAAEQKCCCEKQELREQILVGKINEVALTTKGRFDVLDSTITCLAGKVAENRSILDTITEIIIPKCKICPEVMPRFNTWTTPTNQAGDCINVNTVD